ncbi:outer membrane protein [Pelomonas aquatica]|uniref:Outer membrane protein n=2 Tax=Pelomonas aquatica TaxID=431058 RepID=A0ABU1Z524_9BURK|nr:outer membrane protein [Pelomonas aquatica]
MKNLVAFACTTLMAALIPTTSWSQQSAPGGAAPETSRWAVGLGASSRQLAYAGVERKNRALPLLYFENRWLRFAGVGAEIKLLNPGFGEAQRVTGGLRVKYEDEGFEADDAPRLAGMDERKASIWGGATATWHNPVAQLSAEWVADLSGHSKGQKLLLQAERRFGWGSVSLTPRVQLQWLDRKYVDYYFGVRADEATLARPAHAGQAAMALEAGVRVDYALTARHAVFLDVSGTRLPGEITLSPLVDRKTTSRAAIGYLYRF